MTTLFNENRFENQLDEKIKSIIKSDVHRLSYYQAKVLRKDSEGIWWVRIFGNDEETPIIINKMDMAPGDIVTVTLDSKNHVSIADGNLSSLPVSRNSMVSYVDTLVANTIIATEARFGYLEADYAYLKYAQIDYADITEARIHELSVESTRRYNYLEADTAKIHDLTADTIHATTGYIDTLTSNSITTDKLRATTGYIDQLTAHSITANDIYSDHATIVSLDSTYAQISVLESDYATIAELHSDYAEIDLANVNNAWIQNGTIKDAAIGDAQIIGVSANKLTAGRIDAANINVVNLRTSNLIVDKINGQPVFGDYSFVRPTSAGYANKNPQTEGWYELVNGQFVLSTDTSVQDGKTYYAEGNYVALYDQDYIDSLETRLDQRIDGAVETFTVDAVPTLLNSPANGWAVSEYQSHVGDVAYVTNTASDANGYCYRFAYDNTSQTYMWVLIKDSDVTKALQDLIDAQGDIEGLQTFQTETISWQEDTDEELTSVKGRVSTVETNLGTKVSTTVFNELSQTVDENSATITSMSETLHKGGRNLLAGSTTMEDWAAGSLVEISDGIVTMEGSSTTWNSVVSTRPTYDISLYDGQTKYSLAFDYNSSADCQCLVVISSTSAAVGSVDASRTKYTNWQNEFTLPNTNGAWKRHVLSPRSIAVSQLNAGSGDTSSGYLSVYMRSDTTVLVRHVQLEMGTISTPWSAAPEDTYTISNTVNEVKQTADTNSASIRQVTTTVQNLDGGGRNLLYLTRDFAAKEGATTGGYLSEVIATISNETYKGLKVRTLDYTSTSTSTYSSVANYNSVIVPKVGKTYCFSFYAKGSGEILCFFYPNNTGGSMAGISSQGVESSTNSDGHTAITLSNDWTRYWVKWTPGGTQGTSERHVLIRIYGGNSVSVCGLMFEEAAIPSNWTPAPEDLDGDIVTLTTKTSEITQTLDGVKTVIGYSENQQGQGSSTLVTKVNEIDETVDGHTQSIESVTTTLTEGGRNYLSQDYLMSRANMTYPYTSKGITLTDKGNGLFNLAGTTNATGDFWCFGSTVFFSDGPVSGPQKWTFSISVESGSMPSDIRPQMAVYEGTTWRKNARMDASKTSITFDIESGRHLGDTGFYINASNVVVNFDFRLQMEKGEIATSWVNPAEDLETVDRKYAEYVMTNEQFKTTVGETYSTKAQLSEMARNVLVNTANPTVNASSWSPSSYASTPDNLWRSYTTTGGTISKTTDGVKITFTGNASTGLTVPFIAKNALKAGETVTLSYMYRGTITNAGTPYILNATGANSTQTAQTGTTAALTGDGEWHVAHKTYTVNRTSADGLAFLVCYVNPSANSWIEFRDGTLMLERGDIETRVSTAETQIDQNSNAITLRATKTEAYQMSQPNLSPFFSQAKTDLYSTSDANAYWRSNGITSIASSYITTWDFEQSTSLGEGWAHIVANNTGSSSVYAYFYVNRNAMSLKPSTDYTLLIEWTGITVSGTPQVQCPTAHGGTNGSNDDFFTASNHTTLTAGSGSAYVKATTRASYESGCYNLVRGQIHVPASSSVSGYIRISLYVGDYTGPYKPYAGAQLYASQAELKVANDEIALRATKNEALGNMSLYTPLEYLQSSGTQYINTGVVPTAYPVRVSVEVAYTSVPTSEKDYAGNLNADVASSAAFVMGANTSTGKWYLWGGKAGWNPGPTVTANTKYAVDMEFPDANYRRVVVDGVEYVNYADGYNIFTLGSNAIGLFSGASNRTYDAASVRIYSARIYDGGDLKRDLVPVKRISDSVLGMYDKENDVFYPNVGTGSFTAGAATNWSRKISMASSELSVQAGVIGSKVSKNNVISYINQTPESVKIQASRIEIDGTTVFRNSSSSTTTFADYVSGVADEAVGAIEVGGVNLLRSTKDFMSWTNCGSGTAGSWNTSEGIFTFPATSANGWTEARPNLNVPYSRIRGKTATLSAEVKGTSGQTLSVMVDPYLCASETDDRSSYRNVYLTPTGGGVSTAAFAADGTWQKVHATVDITDAFFSAGTQPSNLDTAYFGARIARLNTNYNSYQIRRVKIEAGNVATDWSMAQEDMTDYVDDVSVGGKNLLHGTADYWNWPILNSAAVIDGTHDGASVIKLEKTDTSNFVDVVRWIEKICPLPSTEYTLSFWAKASAALETYAFFYEGTVASGTNCQGNSVNPGNGSTRFTLSTSWERYWVTWKTNGSLNGTTAKNVLPMRVQNAVTGTFYIAGIMMEIGNKPSAWSPAPEDMPKPNLTPFFSFEPYNTTTGQGAQYWQSYSDSSFTSLGDGWVRYTTYDNTSGSSVVYRQHRPKSIPSLSPNTTYTLLVEFRNVSKTGNVHLRVPDGGQGDTTRVKLLNLVPNSSIDLPVANGTYYKVFVSADSSASNYSTFFGLCTRLDTGAKATYDMRLSLYEGVYCGPYMPYNGGMVLREQRIYYRTTTNTCGALPTAWVTTASNSYNTWTAKVPPIAANKNSDTTTYPYLFTTIQRRLADGTVVCDAAFLDENTTIIDGGSIITNSITANKIQTGSLTVGYFDNSVVTALQATDENLIAYNPDPVNTLAAVYTGQAKTSFPLYAHAGGENSGSKGTPYVTNWNGSTGTSYYLMFGPYAPNRFTPGDVIRFEGRCANWDSAVTTAHMRVWFYSSATGGTPVATYSSGNLTFGQNQWFDFTGVEITIPSNADLTSCLYYLVGFDAGSNHRLGMTANSRCYRVNGKAAANASAAAAAQSTANSASSAAAAAQNTANGAAKQANIYELSSHSAISNAAGWHRIGTLVTPGSAAEATIFIQSGDGFNGNASQNSYITIHIKDAWQSTESATKSFGATVVKENATGVDVQVRASAHNTCEVWVYLPWSYPGGYYQVSGNYTSWTNNQTVQTAAPTSGTAQEVTMANTSATYVTDVNGSGITVHPASGSTSHYVAIDGNGTRVYRNANLKANYADTITLYGGSSTTGAYPLTEISSSAINIKQSATAYASMTSSGLNVYVPVSSTATSVASFGTTTRVGQNAKSHITINDSSVDFYKDASTKLGSLKQTTEDNRNVQTLVLGETSTSTAEVYGYAEANFSNLQIGAYGGGKIGRIFMSGSSTTSTVQILAETISLNGTGTSGIYTKSATGHLDWSTHSDKLITNATLAYWNGRYNSSSSNLAYCNKGAFNTLATKSSVSISTEDRTCTTASAVSVSGGGHASINATCTPPDGYIFAGIFQVTTNQAGLCGVITYSYSSGTFTARVRNFSSGALSTTVTAKIRFIKVTVS